MAPALLKKASQHFIRLSSCDSKNAFTAPLGPEEAGADSLEEQYARKTGGGSKKWNPFLSAFNRRKNTRSESSSSQKNTETAERRYNRRNPWTRSSPEGRTLSTIPEAGVIQARPTVATVERASAAKVFLETYFNELLYKPDARTLRSQCLEAQLCNCLLISSDEKENIRIQYRSQETCHLRELRTMKANSLYRQGKTESALLVNNYEPLQILGKGSFGVVRLVREKPAQGHAFPRQVYAMKVIRKSEMIRNSQEGHLRAERDFLVASEGSQWFVQRKLEL
ncbi:hypothetical protein ACHAPI_000587 [Fusarium lateritium]